MLRSLLFAVLLSGSALAHASQDTARIQLDEGDFAAQRAQIEKDLADGKTYVELSPTDRAKVRESLNRIASEIGERTVDDLDEPARARVFNEQEVVNTILMQAADDSRLVCRHEAATGTRFKKTRCFTVAERQRRMESDQADLRRSQNGIGPLKN